MITKQEWFDQLTQLMATYNSELDSMPDEQAISDAFMHEYVCVATELISLAASGEVQVSPKEL